MSQSVCNQCSAPVTPGSRFCRACGTPQALATCEACGAPVPVGQRLCRRCADYQHQDPAEPTLVREAAPAPAAAQPKPRRSGRALARALVAVVLVFGASGGVGGYFLLVKSGDDYSSSADVPSGQPLDDSGNDASPPAPPSETDKPTEPYRVAERDGFSIEVPDGWSLTDDTVTKSYGVRDTWTGPDDGASVLVDYTPDFRGTALAAARDVRGNARKAAGYEEVEFRSVTFGGTEMVEWRFIQGGEEKVDYFSEACGTGYAVLGAAPDSSFEQYAADFRHAAKTLEPDC